MSWLPHRRCSACEAVHSGEDDRVLVGPGENMQFVARIEPQTGTVAAHEKRLGTGHHTVGKLAPNAAPEKASPQRIERVLCCSADPWMPGIPATIPRQPPIHQRD
jgi:hypothetical protein